MDVRGRLITRSGVGHNQLVGRVVRIENTADKAHWPEFERRAASHGIRSCLALPLRSGLEEVCDAQRRSL